MSAIESLVPDRPLRFSDMLSATFRYLRRNPSATLGVGALLGTVTSTVTGIVLQGMVFGNSRAADLQRLLAGETMSTKEINVAIAQIGEVAPYLGFAGAVAALVQFAAMGVMTLGMVRAMRGERIQPSELWRSVPWRRILGINLLVFAVMLAVVAVPVGIAFAVGGGLAIAALGFAGVLAFVVAVVSTLAVPAAIIDDLGVTAALRRALFVTRGALLRTSVLIFGSLVFWDAIGGLLAGPAGGLFGALSGGATSPSGQALSTLVSGIVSGAITLPSTSAMAVLVYTDRVRRMRPSSD